MLYQTYCQSLYCQKLYLIYVWKNRVYEPWVMFSALNNLLRILAEHKKLNHSRKLRQIREIVPKPTNQ